MRFIPKLITIFATISIFGAQPVVAKNQRNNAYHHVVETSPKNLNPLEAATVDSANLIYAIYDTLYQYRYLKRPLSIKPNLAQDMPLLSKDKLNYTITIKPGVYFVDDPCFPDGKGREVNAYDIADMFKRHFFKGLQSNGRWLWEGKILGMSEWSKKTKHLNGPIEGIKVLNKHKIRISLTNPFPQFLATLTTSYSAIIPREAIDFYGKGISRHPVGSGPYTLKSFNESKAVLIKNSKFRIELFQPADEGFDLKIHDKRMPTLANQAYPFSDKIVVHFIKDPGVMWASFNKSNEIQLTWIGNDLSKYMLKRDGHFTLKKELTDKYSYGFIPEFGFVYLEYNLRHPTIAQSNNNKIKTRNKLLRCAIRSAYDWINRREKIYSGIGDLFPGVIPPFLPSYDHGAGTESINQDLKEAKKMLTEYLSTGPLPSIEYSDTIRIGAKQDFALFKNWMVKAGFPKDKIKFKGFANFADFWQAKQQSKLMISSVSWSLDYPDAENILQLYYSKNIGASNASGYHNPKFDKLFERAHTARPLQERIQLYRQMNEILIEDCAVISGLVRKRAYLWHKKIVLYPSKEFMGNFFKYIKIL